MIEETSLAGVVTITPKWFSDNRGAFCETYSQRTWETLGLTGEFFQDNHSISRETGTVRGLHFQRPPDGQAKLVRVVTGAIWDVAVDIRRGSSTYGKWVGAELSAENGKQLFVPEGFLHGFVTRAPNTEVVYKCSGFYAPAQEGSVLFSDPDLGIDWGIPNDTAVLSDKDAIAGSFAELDSPFSFSFQTSGAK